MNHDVQRFHVKSFAFSVNEIIPSKMKKMNHFLQIEEQDLRDKRMEDPKTPENVVKMSYVSKTVKSFNCDQP